MRLSLTNLIWSVIFASLGLACLSFLVSYKSWHWYVLNVDRFILLYQLVNVLTGVFFGAAIGTLFRRRLAFIFAGAILSLAISVVMFLAMAIQSMA